MPTIGSIPDLAPTLAISWGGVGITLLTVLGMMGLGVVVWRLLQRQEKRDPAFLQRLDDDDARAERGDG